MDKLKNDRNRSSTKANYYCIWRSFNEFIIKLDTKPATWEERLVLFVGYLIQNNRKSTTIRSYISAIKAVLREDGEILNEDTYLLTSLTRACKLKNDRVHTRLPIKMGMIEILIDQCDTMFQTQPYLLILYKSMIITAYYGLFRVGEIAKGSHAVKACDVHIGKNKNKLMFILHTSKTHGRDAQPQIVKINATSDSNMKKCNSKSELRYCPFALLKQYVRMRKDSIDAEEQFFVFRDRTPVTATNFRIILKNLLKTSNFDYRCYNTHSIRAGRSVDLFFKMKISLQMVKKLGRWKSNIIYKYLNYH